MSITLRKSWAVVAFSSRRNGSFGEAISTHVSKRPVARDLVFLGDFDEISNRPDRRSDSGSHRRSAAKRFMDARAIVMSEIDRGLMTMILYLLAEGVGESRHAARFHPDVEVLPLDVRCGDELRVRLAEDGFQLRADEP